jgi:probable rRNA maturation factor
MKLRLGLNLVNDTKAKNLHQLYFSDPSTTDTMSFPINESTPDGDYYLGDIVINIDQLRRQANELDVPEKEELARLITHSTLHLLGFDDQGAEEEKLMRQSENNVLSKIFKKFTQR